MGAIRLEGVEKWFGDLQVIKGVDLDIEDGAWERGVPVDDPSWPHDPEGDGDGSGSCYVTDNSSGPSDIDGGAVRLTSPLFDMSGDDAFTIEYLYFLRINGRDGDDGMSVETLFESRMKDARPEDYLIRVNRQPVAREQVLQPGDRISITPIKIEGAV